MDKREIYWLIEDLESTTNACWLSRVNNNHGFTFTSDVHKAMHFGTKECTLEYIDKIQCHFKLIATEHINIDANAAEKEYTPNTFNGFGISVVENPLMTDGNAILFLSTVDYKNYKKTHSNE